MNPNQSIINPDIEPWTFTVALALEAHSRADEFRRYHSNPDKAKQVYLNTLAVYAVNLYLQCRGFETDLENSNSWNPVMQTLMDTADLVVKNCGKLECRPLLPEAEFVCVPVDVWTERIGYIAVQFTESLREATLLGFVEKVTSSKLSLSELRSLQQLPGHLNTIKPEPVIHLSQWFENIFEAGWQTVEAFLATQPNELAFRFRSAPQSEELAVRFRKIDVERCKLIEFGRSEQSVTMIVSLTEQSEQTMDISVEVLPKPGQTYLPSNLEVMVLNEDGEAVMDIQAGADNKMIQLMLQGEAGDLLGIKVALGDISVTENFVI
jgi:hypothetical protein